MKSGKKLVIGIDGMGIRTGGSFVYLKNLLESFDQNEFPEIKKIIVWGIADVLNKINTNGRIEKIPVKLLESSNPLKLLAWKLYNQLYAAPKHCDILYVPGGIVINSRIRKVIMLHNLLPFEYNIRSEYKGTLSFYKFVLLEKLYVNSLKQADGVIYPTHFTKEMIAVKTGITAENNRVIYHSIGKPFREYRTNGRKLKNSKLNLLCISFVANYKGQIDLLNEVEVLIAKGIDLNLILAGPVSARLRDRFLKKIERINRKYQCIEYIGKVDYDLLPALYANCDAVVFPSRLESFGFPVLESIYFNKPLIIRNKNLVEIIEKFGASGYYIWNHNFESILKEIYNKKNTIDGTNSGVRKYSNSPATFSFLINTLTGGAGGLVPVK